MKQFLIITVTIFSLTITGCKPIDKLQDSSKLYCKASNNFDKKITDKVIFTQDDIVWLNISTKELKLKSSLNLEELQNYNKFIFYLDNDSLFTATRALDIMSSIVDDLVMHFSNNAVYLENGYPNWIVDEQRTKNMEKREKNWQLFIQKLKNEGKLND